jgi:hypothetical protein
VAPKKFLESGSPVVTRVPIPRINTSVRFLNPEKLGGNMVLASSLGRIHSEKNGVYSVWILDELTYNTIILEVPLHMMGQYFAASSHNMFPHFA